MEPLDNEYMITEESPAKPVARLSYMLILPILGGVLLLFFLLAAIFQFSIADLVDTIIGTMTVFFFIMVAMLFWGLAPKPKKA